MTTKPHTVAATRIPAIFRELDAAVLFGDATSTFDRYTLKDYLFTSPSGTLSNKTQVLEALRAGEAHFTSYSTSDILVRDYGSMAVVHGSASGEGMNPGAEPFHGRYRFTSIWAYHDGDWRLAAWQATAIT